MLWLRNTLFLAASLLLIAAAVAQPRPGGGGPRPGGGPAPGPSGGAIVRVQPQQLAQLFTEAGFQSKVVQNGNTTLVQSEFWPGVFSGALVQGCEKDGSGCHGFKLFANLGTDSAVDQKWIDGWNNTWLYVRALKADNGALLFMWDVALLTGVSPEYVKSSAQLFKVIVDASTDFKPQ